MPKAKKSLRDFVHAVRSEPLPDEVPFFAANNTDPQWAAKVENGYHMVPAVFRRIVATAERVLILARRPPDIGEKGNKPNLKDFYKRSPRETGGFYDCDQKAIVVMQEAFSKAVSKYVNNGYVTEQTVHEFTHGLDDVLGLSDLPEVKAAYALDKIDLCSDDVERAHFGYLLQNEVGLKEAIAEQGTTIWTQGSITGQVDFSRWPNLTTWMESFFHHFEEDYDPAKGSPQDQVKAAAKAAEKDLLLKLMDREKVLYTALGKLSADSTDLWEDHPNGWDGETYQTRHKMWILERLVERQGLHETRKTYCELQQTYKAMAEEFYSRPVIQL